jgi:hypothetical protein
MVSDTQSPESRPATAARIYDYLLGGTHNFPADRAAAKQGMELFPLLPAMTRANRAMLGRVVRFLADSGVRQFLDIGSGMPTEGNVHEIAQEIAPEARVVYVDIDPVAVAESLEILEHNPTATAICSDLRQPRAILDHPQTRRLLDFSQPVGLLLVAVLHFVPDDAEAHAAVAELRAALTPGSYLAISHVAAEGFQLSSARPDSIQRGQEIYRRQTTASMTPRTREQVLPFFAGTQWVEPGLVSVAEWRPAPGDPADFADDPARSAQWGGVGSIQ